MNQRSAAKQGPRWGGDATLRGLELGQMLVVGQAANDRRGAQIRQAMLVAQQGKQHFRIEEAAAVQERKDEVGHRPIEQRGIRSEEHTSELQSLMRISYAVFCLKKQKQTNTNVSQMKITYT